METKKEFTLVTGATSGLGLELVRELCGQGESVIACGRTFNHFLDLSKFGGGITKTYAFDLRNVSEIATSLRTYLEENEIRVKGFVHCAGVSPISPLRLMDAAAIRDVLAVNVCSCLEILRVLTARRVNHSALKSVVLISSIASVRGTSGMSAYCASKGALDAAARALAVEMAPHVRINTVRPGALPTEILEKAGVSPEIAQDFREHPEAHGSLLGCARLSDVTALIRYLLSEEARFITGQCFTVDGGVTAH